MLEGSSDLTPTEQSQSGLHSAPTLAVSSRSRMPWFVSSGMEHVGCLRADLQRAEDFGEGSFMSMVFDCGSPTGALIRFVLLQHPLAVQELQEGSFFIHNPALGGENSSKMSSF